MDKFIFSSLLYEVYKEILFITYNYQKERIEPYEIKEDDYKALEKSKALYSFSNRFSMLNEDFGSYLDSRFLETLINRQYDKESVTYMIEYMNDYVDYYLDYMHKVIDRIALVSDVKERSNGLKGEYPLYLKIEEKMLIIKRLILNTNAGTYLDKKTKRFGFKVTYVEYNVPINNYSFNGKDLRGMKKDEIIKMMDNSVKVNMQNSTFYDTDYLLYKDNPDDYSDGEISLFLDKRYKQDSVKVAMKASLKSALISFLIFTAIIAMVLIYKYVIKG